MKLITVTLTCAAFALALTACTETTAPTNTPAPTAVASPTATPDEFAGARANFQKNCEACHGENAEGGLVKVDNKQIKVPSLKSERAAKHTDEHLTKMITNGEEEMPSFKDKLSPQEIADMVRYVRNIQGK